MPSISPRGSSKRAKYARAKSGRRLTKSRGRLFGTLPLIRSIVPPRQNGLPRELRTTLVYCDSFPLGAAARFATAFNMNSLFDPDNTGTGHQPMYFDQIMALYDHYKVVASKVTCWISNAATTSAIAILALDDDGSGAANLNSAMETANSTMKQFSQGVPAVLTRRYSAAQSWGPAWMNQDSLIGTSSASPTELTTAILTMGSVDKVTLITADITFRIEYDTIFTELATVGGS